MDFATQLREKATEAPERKVTNSLKDRLLRHADQGNNFIGIPISELQDTYGSDLRDILGNLSLNGVRIGVATTTRHADPECVVDKIVQHRRARVLFSW